MIKIDDINNIKGDYDRRLSKLLRRCIKNNFAAWSFTDDYRWDNSTIQLVIIFPFNNMQNNNTIDILFTQYDISNDLIYLGTTHTNKHQQSFIADLIEIIKPVVLQFIYELVDQFTLSVMRDKVHNELINYLSMRAYK